jgi:hypothetical protein
VMAVFWILLERKGPSTGSLRQAQDRQGRQGRQRRQDRHQGEDTSEYPIFNFQFSVTKSKK